MLKNLSQELKVWSSIPGFPYYLCLQKLYYKLMSIKSIELFWLYKKKKKRVVLVTIVSNLIECDNWLSFGTDFSLHRVKWVTILTQE